MNQTKFYDVKGYSIKKTIKILHAPPDANRASYHRNEFTMTAIMIYYEQN